MLQHVGNPDLQVVLQQLSKTNYSWEELQTRPLPDGVDPSRLEKYLSDSDFEVSNIRCFGKMQPNSIWVGVNIVHIIKICI